MSYRARGWNDDLSWLVVQASSGDEIRAMINDFAQSALGLQRCGFSGVECHLTLASAIQTDV